MTDSLLVFIQQFSQERGIPPSVSEMTNALNISSRGVTYAKLNKLRRSGLLTWIEGKDRTWKVV